MELKRGALQKFINEDISKADYDDFVNMVQDKLHQLETEKLETKKMMAENDATTKVPAIKKQLNEYLNFNTLTTEMLCRFV